MGYEGDRLVYHRFEMSWDDEVEASGYRHLLDLRPGEKIVDAWTATTVESDVPLYVAVEYDLDGVATLIETAIFATESGAVVATTHAPDLWTMTGATFGLRRDVPITERHRVLAAFPGAAVGEAVLWLVVSTASA